MNNNKKSIFIVLSFLILLVLTSLVIAEQDEEKTTYKKLQISNPLTTIDFTDDIGSYLTEDQLKDKVGISYNQISIDSNAFTEFKNKKATITMNSLCLENPVAFHNGIPDYSVKAKQKGLCKWEFKIKGFSTWSFYDTKFNGTFNQTAEYVGDGDTYLGLAQDSLAIFKFNDNSSTIYDSSLTALEIDTITPDLLVSNCKYGDICLNFSESGFADYLKVQSSTANPEFTWCAWINSDYQADGNDRAIYHLDNLRGFQMMIASSNNIYTAWYNASGDFNSLQTVAGSLAIGWTSMCNSYNAGTDKIYQYVDGLELANVEATGYSPSLESDNLYFSHPSVHEFNGNIQCVQSWNTPLSDAQILNINNSLTCNPSVNSDSNTEEFYTESWIGWVKINSTDPLTNDPLQNLTTYTDQDDNATLKLNYNWKVDGTSLAILNTPFEDNKTSYLGDYSGNGFFGTIVGGTTYSDTTGYDGFGGLYFDGVGDYVDYNDPFYTDALSFCAWINPDTVDANPRTVILKRNLGATASTDEYGLGQYDEGLYYYSYNGGAVLGMTYTTPLVVGKYVHICVTQPVGSGQLGYIYLNGVAVNWSEKTGAMANTGSDLQLATRTSDNDNRYFKGYIDEFIFFNRQITAEQVDLIFRNQSKNMSSTMTKNGEAWQSCITPNNRSEDNITRCSNELTINGITEAEHTWELNTWTKNQTDTVTNNGSFAIDMGAFYSHNSYNVTARKSYQFDGFNDYLNIGTQFNTANSISLWINTTTLSANDRIIDNGDGTKDWTLQMESGTLVFQNDSSGTNNMLTTTGTFNDGLWHHVVVTMSPINIYVDNIDVATTASNPSLVNVGQASIGSSAGTSLFYEGLLDDIRIFNKTLTVSKINDLYTNASKKFKYHGTGDFITQIYNASVYISPPEVNVWTSIELNTTTCDTEVSYGLSRAGDCSTIETLAWVSPSSSTGCTLYFNGLTGNCFQAKIGIYSDTNTTIEIYGINVTGNSTYAPYVNVSNIWGGNSSLFNVTGNATYGVNGSDLGSINFTWYVNGELIFYEYVENIDDGESVDVQLDNSYFVKDDNVWFKAIPYNNYIQGFANYSDNITIGNADFTVTWKPNQNTTTAKPGSGRKFTATISDIDNDVNVSWYVEGVLTSTGASWTYLPSTSDVDSIFTIIGNASDGEFSYSNEWEVTIEEVNMGLAMVAVMLFLGGLMIVFGLATWYFDNGLKFFFLLLTGLVMLVGLNISATVAASVSESIGNVLWVVYRVGLVIFMFLFFVVLTKLMGELKLRRNAINTDNLDSPGQNKALIGGRGK